MSEDNSHPDLMRRIWCDKVLQQRTKIHLCQAIVMSIVSYAAEPWELLSCDEKMLQAFHRKCQHQILHIHGSQLVTNAEVSVGNGLLPVMDSISRCCLTTYSTTQFGSLRGLQHAMPYIVKSAWHPVIHFVGTGDVILIILALAGQTNFATTLDLSLPTSGGRHGGAM